MKRRVVTISYTGLDAPGGVPRWNRDFHSAFPDRERVHFCWQDFPAWSEGHALLENVKAHILSGYLLRKRLVTDEDVVVVDGFWGAGLEHLPFLISVCHGIWGHVTAADVAAGKQPENPILHAAQVSFRKRLAVRNGRMVSVSDFIADEMKLQWNLEVPVINTGIDLDEWKPVEHNNSIPLVIHGVNDRGNLNKGWDHIEAIESQFTKTADVFSLDQVCDIKKCSRQVALASADVCLIPSGFEGNSLFCLEALACDVPIVAYDVGLPYLRAKTPGFKPVIGRIVPRQFRTPQMTAAALGNWLATKRADDAKPSPREWVSQFSIQNFRQQWYDYVEAMG